MGIEDKIISKLNVELGGKIENLSRSKALVDRFVGEINTIEKKVSENLKFPK